ncbi:MAG TPA: hypothetical protein VJM11_06460, partial [Nevskiaceae bacterium]|nr:hypothetical protein [Nevskiaceae bacterium]
DSGIVYNPDLTYAGSLGGGFGSIAFSEDAIFVSRDREVVRFNHSFIETGRVTARRFVDSIAVRAGRVFAFEQGDSGKPKVQIFESSAFQVLPPNPPVDPNGLAYIVDDAFITKDRLVYLLSREHKNIFVWSVDDRAYRDSIPLVGAPLYFAHDAESQRVVLAYDSGLITTIPLADVPAETPLVNSPQTPCGLAMAGPYVFVCDPSGAWESHFTYSPAGTLIDQRDWNYYSQEYIWSQANRRMYFFRDDTSPNDLHFEVVKSDGTLGDEGETPYHDSNGIAHPIRVSDDGVLIVLGSGRIYDAIGMTHIDNLGGVDSIDDADWRGRQLFTIRPDGAKTVLDRWTTTYVSAEQKRFRGLPIRLFVVNKRDVLVITNRGGVPTFYVTRQPALPG